MAIECFTYSGQLMVRVLCMVQDNGLRVLSGKSPKHGHLGWLTMSYLVTRFHMVIIRLQLFMDKVMELFMLIRRNQLMRS